MKHTATPELEADDIALLDRLTSEHVPVGDLPLWQIWHESYQLMECEGGYQKAGILGVAQGESFDDACDNWNRKGVHDPHRIIGKPGDRKFYGARVFPSKTEAVAVSTPYVPFDPDAEREWCPPGLTLQEAPKWLAEAIGDSRFVTLRRKPFHAPEILWHGNDATGAAHEGDVNTYRVIR